MKKMACLLFSLLISLNVFSFEESDPNNTFIIKGVKFSPNAEMDTGRDASLAIYRGVPITYTEKNNILTTVFTGDKVEVLSKRTIGIKVWYWVKAFDKETESIKEGYLYSGILGYPQHVILD